MMNRKAQIHGLLILIATSFIVANVANCWSPFTLIEYHLCMMNESPIYTLSLMCDKMVGAQPSNRDALIVYPHSSFNWSFHPATWVELGPRSYYCVAWFADPTSTRKKLTALFRAFLDKPWFVDGQCEGRHCIWRYNETGIYLFHLHRYEYEFMLPWNVTDSE